VSIITLFTTVDDSVSTSWKSTIHSAAIRSVAEDHSFITFLTFIEISITALEGTGGRASVSIHLVTVIAGLMVRIKDAISTTREDAVGSADSIAGVGIGSSEVAFFIAFLNTITTVRESAVGSACIWSDIIIGSSKITLLSSVADSVSAQECAVA